MIGYVVMAVVAVLLAQVVYRTFNRVDALEARTMVFKGALLVDVRPPRAFASEHLPHAQNIPFQDFARRLRELGRRDRTFIVYGGRDGKSAAAAGLLRRAGYTHVHDLGPMSRWRRG